MFPIKNKKDLITLKGLIIPIDWDNKGNAISIAISTHGEKEYIICNDDKGKELFNFIQDSVKVRGTIKEMAGFKLIQIDEMEKCILGLPDESTNSMDSSNQHTKFPKEQN